MIVFIYKCSKRLCFLRLSVRYIAALSLSPLMLVLSLSWQTIVVHKGQKRKSMRQRIVLVRICTYWGRLWKMHFFFECSGMFVPSLSWWNDLLSIKMVQRNSSFSHLYKYMNELLPRQARDKHRENSKKDGVVAPCTNPAAIIPLTISAWTRHIFFSTFLLLFVPSLSW